MKYIKHFENNFESYYKNYLINSNILGYRDANILSEDINTLNKNNIIFSIYYNEQLIFDIIVPTIKLYCSYFNKILDKLNFDTFYTSAPYNQLEGWEKITEEELTLKLDSLKYNL